MLLTPVSVLLPPSRLALDVAREAVPRRRVGRRRLTEGEAGELDEEIFNRDVAAARDVQRVRQSARERRERGRIGAAEIVELEVALAEGANHAVLGRGAGIHRQRQTGAGNEVIAVAVLLAEVTVPGRRAVGAAVERGVGAQIAADLDAGVGARNVEEAGAVKRTDPYIFDCLGLDRKVGRLCPAQGYQACRRAENECWRFNHKSFLCRDSQSPHS